MTAHISPRLEREAQRLGILPPEPTPAPLYLYPPHPVEPASLRTATVVIVVGAFLLWWGVLYVAFSV